MQTIILGIGGMTCGGCVAAVTKLLARIDGVGDVTVTLTPPQARVSFDPAATQVEQLKAAVEDAGYAVAA